MCPSDRKHLTPRGSFSQGNYRCLKIAKWSVCINLQAVWKGQRCLEFVICQSRLQCLDHLKLPSIAFPKSPTIDTKNCVCVCLPVCIFVGFPIIDGLAQSHLKEFQSCLTKKHWSFCPAMTGLKRPFTP